MDEGIGGTLEEVVAERAEVVGELVAVEDDLEVARAVDRGAEPSQPGAETAEQAFRPAAPQPGQPHNRAGLPEQLRRALLPLTGDIGQQAAGVVEVVPGLAYRPAADLEERPEAGRFL